MIGKPVSATLWGVAYRFRNFDPPLVTLTAGEAPEHIEGTCNVLTADPTGCDLLDVTAREVLGPKLKADHEFTLTHVHRVFDVNGLASVKGGDD